MFTRVSCRWCHALAELVLGPFTACPNCGHTLAAPRSECRCIRCLIGRRRVANVLAQMQLKPGEEK